MKVPTIRRNINITADEIANAFSMSGTVPALSDFTDLGELRRTYEEQSGPTHYFDPETLRFFGSRNRHLAARGVYVETQTKAPEGVGRYAVTAWVWATTDGGNHLRLTPVSLANFASLDSARRFARNVAANWPTPVADAA